MVTFLGVTYYENTYAYTHNVRNARTVELWRTVHERFTCSTPLFEPISHTKLILGKYYRVPRPAWDATAYFTRCVMSRDWTGALCDLGADRDPGPSYPVAEGISAAVFDNLSIQVNYRVVSIGRID